MILEDATGMNERDKIIGGGQQIEDEDDELQEEDEEDAEYLDNQ